VLSSTAVSKCSSSKTSVFQREKKNREENKIHGAIYMKKFGKKKAEPALSCLLAINTT